MPTNDPHLPNQLWHAKFTIMTGAVRKVLLKVVLLTYLLILHPLIQSSGYKPLSLNNTQLYRVTRNKILFH